MKPNLNELARAMSDLTGRALEDCLADLNLLPEGELEKAMARAEAERRAYMAALGRGENLEVELPPGRRPWA